MSVSRPAAISGQPRACGGVGSPKRSMNQAEVSELRPVIVVRSLAAARGSKSLGRTSLQVAPILAAARSLPWLSHLDELVRIAPVRLAGRAQREEIRVVECHLEAGEVVA